MTPRLMTHDVFRAIADPTRRQVLDLLLASERNVNELLGHFRMSQPAMSQHLRILRETGLVTQRRSGRERIYQVRPDVLRPVGAWVGQYERFWRRKLRTLGEFLESER